jgi:hypothetical protein
MSFIAHHLFNLSSSLLVFLSIFFKQPLLIHFISQSYYLHIYKILVPAMSDDLQASAAVGDATNPCSLVHQFFTTDTSFIQETPGDLFDAPDGAAIIRTNLIY